MTGRPPRSPLFPTPPLSGPPAADVARCAPSAGQSSVSLLVPSPSISAVPIPPAPTARPFPPRPPATPLRRDRKSTRLNSSHLVISYAVFCLKKKNLVYPSL